MKLRRIVVVLFAAVGMVGCAPDPGPSPTWSTTRLARTVAGDDIVNHVGAWTNDDWFATIRVESTSTGTDGTMRFFPRTGRANSKLGEPQVLPAPSSAGLTIMGDNVVVVGTSEVAFYVNSGGVWAPAGTLSLPIPYQLAGLTDDWLIARRMPGFPDGEDGDVRVYGLSVAGGTVTAALTATLVADPALSATQRQGFAVQATIDGELIAVSGNGYGTGEAGYVQLFRPVGGAWTSVQTLGGTAAESPVFGQTIAVDDGDTVDRLVTSPQSDTDRRVDIWTDSGSGFTLTDSIAAPTPHPSATTPELFGFAVAIDGDRLATVAHHAAIPSADTAHDPVKVAFVQVYERESAGWALEREFSTHPTPPPPGITSSYPYRLQMSGSHIAVTEFVSPDPPPGCSFPCFVMGMEAWSLDRL